MSSAKDHTEIVDIEVLSKALTNAAKELGLTQKDAGQVIGKDRATTLTEASTRPLKPVS